MSSIALTTPLNLGGCVTDYRHYVETRDRYPEGSKTASTPPYILIADQYYLQITAPISAIYYPIIPYYPHLLRVYIEALELHLQSSRSCIPHSAKAYISIISSCLLFVPSLFGDLRCIVRNLTREYSPHFVQFYLLNQKVSWRVRWSTYVLPPNTP